MIKDKHHSRKLIFDRGMLACHNGNTRIVLFTQTPIVWFEISILCSVFSVSNRYQNQHATRSEFNETSSFPINPSCLPSETLVISICNRFMQLDNALEIFAGNFRFHISYWIQLQLDHSSASSPMADETLIPIQRACCIFLAD